MLILVFLFPLPIFAAGSLLGLITHAVRRLREGGRPRLASPFPLAMGAVLTACGAGMLRTWAEYEYAYSFRPVHLCANYTDHHGEPERETTIPLSVVCDGVELIPAWVNPTFFGLLAFAAITMTAAVVIGVRRAAAP
ncbi:hypothetical protein ACL02R_04650 [Streptomyces sp. MS19]|uniref:hypothetical protein n=1 Tax=Streptomyces sp. MS19 TaxID=3385972 RepID=UPI0039A145BA